MADIDRREGARILRETVALLEALEQDQQEHPGYYANTHHTVLAQLMRMRSGLESVAERLAEDEARESEGKAQP